ncbi:MAG: hypothetical protein KC656_07975, partial [Myxococcales bacterium]|nr:hypothetical protein [Myxococcales bacterium]
RPSPSPSSAHPPPSAPPAGALPDIADADPEVPADDGIRLPPDGVPDPRPWTREPIPPEDGPRWTVEPLPEPPPVVAPTKQLNIASDSADIDADLALQLVVEAMQTSRTHPHLAPAPLDAITPVLLLHRAGHGREARDAWKEVQGWLDAAGLGIRIPQSVAARLLLCRELSELPPYFPTDVRRRIATAILDNDLAGAGPDMVGFRRATPIRARDAADLLREHTANLDTLYGRLLLPEEDRRPPPEPVTEESPEPDEDTTASEIVVGLLATVFLLAVLAAVLRACVPTGGIQTEILPVPLVQPEAP